MTSSVAAASFAIPSATSALASRLVVRRRLAAAAAAIGAGARVSDGEGDGRHGVAVERRLHDGESRHLANENSGRR